MEVSCKNMSETSEASDASICFRYMGQMYTLDAFTVSCPADQDILSHYKMQQGAKMSRREELETPTFTNDVPAQ